jgi:twitching motility two-component system response regulator PilG
LTGSLRQTPENTTVLVVDDSASVRKLVELTLRREGFAVISATSGIAALATLADTQPDVILMDVMLLELDGFQLCRVIRRHPKYENTPIVMLSGREGESDKAAGFAAGVDAYLTKPFKPAVLIATVREQMTACAASGVV